MDLTANDLDTFTGKLMDQGKFPSDLSTKALTQPPQPVLDSRADQSIQTPPRIVSDQLINIYFQEWAPLYPVVHRPTVLRAYERYLNSAESLHDSPCDLTQLNLIFGIAALASIVRTAALPELRGMANFPHSREPTRTPSFLRETGRLLLNRSPPIFPSPPFNALSWPRFIA